MRALYELPAPAKINAFLHIIGKRADGYHLLQSPFVLLDWADTLHFELRSDGQLRRHDLGAQLPADDLCLRAARALQTTSAVALGADISIHKRVPWGAGLGGGSSNAATTLLALNRLWKLNWPRARLLHLAQSLGADVPFFVFGHNAFVEGVGEKLRPMAWRRARYAVVKPAAPLLTHEVFSHPALIRDTEPVILTGSLESGQESLGCVDGTALWQSGFGRNDLQAAAISRCPEVALAARWLEDRFGNSRMTGSGSAVFARAGEAGVNADADANADVNAGMKVDTNSPSMATFPPESLPAGWVGRMCRSLEHHPLVGWAD